MLPNEAHELRHICVLPVFLGRWYGTSPAEATAVIEAAVQERRIELDSEGQDARPHHNPHYHALLHKDHPEYRTIIGNGKSDK